MGKRDRLVSPADVPEVFTPWSSRAFGSFFAAFVLGGVVCVFLAAFVVKQGGLESTYALLLGLVGMHTLVSLYLLHVILKAQAVLISQVSQMAEVSRVNQDLMIMQVDRRNNDNQDDKQA